VGDFEGIFAKKRVFFVDTTGVWWYTDQNTLGGQDGGSAVDELG
jgi:hypothetical protein